jgi:GNAT superfamily N-acetyltransferase
MTLTTVNDLYDRGAATLLASWEEYARGAVGAALKRLSGVAAAVFPSGPERGVYNNALFDRDLHPSARAYAIEAMEAAYASARVDRFAAWVHGSDAGMREELSGRGYTVDEVTRVMGMSLQDIAVARPELDFEPLDWPGYVAYLEAAGVAPGLLASADPTAFHLLAHRDGGENVATGLAFDHGGDCGIYNMSTVESARRRGLGTALTARLVHDAAGRGCSTASLQATVMGERVYAGGGFRDLGRYFEYVP